MTCALFTQSSPQTWNLNNLDHENIILSLNGYALEENLQHLIYDTEDYKTNLPVVTFLTVWSWKFAFWHFYTFSMVVKPENI